MNKKYNEALNITGKILFIIVLYLFANHSSYAQVLSVQKDSISVKMKNTELVDKGKDKNIKEITNKQTAEVGNRMGPPGIKQIKGARMDMSKARGARPPNIVRPGGSSIPRGVGKPGGAMRPGRR